jgi:hypothetical protein
MEVTTLSDEEVGKLREKTKPVWTKFTQEFGEPTANELFAELERIRGGKK